MTVLRVLCLWGKRRHAGNCNTRPEGTEWCSAAGPAQSAAQVPQRSPMQSLPASPRPSFSTAALRCVLPHAQQPPGLLLHLLCCCFPRLATASSPAAGLKLPWRRRAMLPHAALAAPARSTEPLPGPPPPPALPFVSLSFFFRFPKQAATGSFKHSPTDYSPACL